MKVLGVFRNLKMISSKSKAIYRISLLFSCSVFLAACSDNNDSAKEPSTTQKVRSLIEGLALTGDPSMGRNLPTINEPKAQLGMKLFFSKALGGDSDAACVTCHHPALGGGDDLSLPVGVDAKTADLLGPGRFHSEAGEHFDGGPTVPRNAPTTFNIGLWDKVLFHDGRVESLGGTAGMNGNDGQGIRTPDVAFGQIDASADNNLTTAQARFPVTSGEEMKNFTILAGTNNSEVRTNLAQRLGDYGTPLGGFLAVNNWLVEFQVGFEDPTGTAEELINFANIVEAIGDYENSQVLVETPWKAFVQGDNQAIAESAKRGALLFFKSSSEGGAACAACHSGDFFTDEGFHVTGLPQIGRGKGDGLEANDDFGRFRETNIETDKYAFRTPSLLNVTATGPWGHAGAHTSLESVVKYHLNPQFGLDDYDFSQIAPNIQAVDMVPNTQLAIDTLAANREAGVASLEDIDLTEGEITDLLSFLRSLTDPCVEDRVCIGQWVPDASDSNPDALRLNAINENSDFL